MAETQAAAPEPSKAPEPTASPEPSPAPSPEPNGNAEPANLAIEVTTPEPVEPEVEPDWRGDWREKFAGNDAEDLKTLNRFKSPDGVYKAYKALRQKMSGGEYTRNKPDGDDEKQLAEWRKEVGVPDAPEGYYEVMPEEVKIPDADKPFIDMLFKEMHGVDASPETVKRGVETFYRMQAADEEFKAERDAKDKQRTEDELRAEWGPEYRVNWTHMSNVLFDSGLFVQAPEGLKDKLFNARNADGTTFGNDPDMLRWMVDMARVINPDVGHSVTPVPGKSSAETVASRIKELESMSADTRGQYWKGPNADALQAELRQLYSVEERQHARNR